MHEIPLVIADHDMTAHLLKRQFNGSLCVIRKPFEIPILANAPQNALVLIELFLPDATCGLSLAKALREKRPDLVPLV